MLEINTSREGLVRTTNLVPVGNAHTAMFFVRKIQTPAGPPNVTVLFYWGDDPVTLYTNVLHVTFETNGSIRLNGPSQSAEYTLPDNGLYHVAFVRNGTSQKLYVNGVERISVTNDISAFPAPTHQYLSTDTFAVDWDSHEIGYFREWNVALTLTEIIAEMHSADFAVVKTADLWADTPLVADILDDSGNGYDWTGFMLSATYTTGVMNQDADHARPVVTPPISITQEAHDGGTTYDLWYKYQALSSERVLGIFGIGDLSSYNVLTHVLVGLVASQSTYLSLGGITNKPLQIPVFTTQTPSGLYYFRFQNQSGNPTPAQLTVSIQTAAKAQIPEGSLFINDDTDDFPGVFRSATDGAVLNFVSPFPNGEGGDQIETTGVIVVENFADNRLEVYDKDFDFVRNITFGNGFTWVKANKTAERFVSINNDNPPTYILIDEDGNSLGTTSMTGEPQGVGAVTINNTAAIIYWAAGTAGSSVRRWDVGAGAALSDFVAGVSGHIVTELEFLSDGTILIMYSQGLTVLYVERRDESGTLLNTYTLDNEAKPSGTNPRMARGLDHSTFWAWTHNTDGSSRWREVRISDGTVVTDLNNQVEYEVGIYNLAATLTPNARFGHSFSCYFFIIELDDGSGGITANNTDLSILVGGVTGGLYEIVPGNRKTNDTLWQSFPSTTTDVKKPNPTAITGDIGE